MKGGIGLRRKIMALILLISVASIRRKLLKMINTNSENCEIYDSDRKKSMSLIILNAFV